MPSRRPLELISCLCIGLALGTTAAAQPTIWSGLTKTFTKAAFSDHTLPQNQDALTTNVVLTRGSSGGMINYAAEQFFTQSVSPALTEWATDLNNSGKTITATNWAELDFTNWLNAYGGPGTQGALIPNRGAVVHLIPDDIYLDLRFTSWDPFNGGGYSYLRAEPPMLPAPTGDYNGNGVVDAADYVVWRKTLDQTVDPEGSGADGDISGTIDSGDYTYWSQRFGNIVVAGGNAGRTAAVPEPATHVVLLGLLALRPGSRRRT